MFVRLQATDLLDDDLRRSMPRVGWVRSIDDSAQGACRPLLYGEALNTGQRFVLASRVAGRDLLHFRVQESCQDVLHERYHSGLQPTLEMRLPFNYSTLPHWFLRLGRFARSRFMVAEPSQVFPTDVADAMAVVDWLRQLADRCGAQSSPRFQWPMHYKSALVVTHDVDSDWILCNRMWLARMHQDEANAGIRGAWFAVPAKSRSTASEDGLRWLRDHGCEIGCHGYNHDAKLPLKLGTKEFERRWSVICRFCDRWRARGFRSEWLYRTPEFLGQLAKRFDYDTSVPTSSRYLTKQTGNGCGTWFPYRAEGGVLELPVSLPLDVEQLDTQLDLRGFWQEQIRKAKQIAAAGGLIVLTIHPQPHQAARSDTWPVIAEALEEISNIRGLWITRPSEVVDWCVQRDRQVRGSQSRVTMP